MKKTVNIKNKSDLNNYICGFVQSKLKYLKEDINSLGFTSKKEMLKCILSNESDAAWAFTELMAWGFDRDYITQYKVGQLDDEYGTPVYKIQDLYFTCNQFKFKEVVIKPITIYKFFEI